jgi:hypothetical protein
MSEYHLPAANIPLRGASSRTIIIQTPSEAWLSQLTPMTRFILAASYYDVSRRRDDDGGQTSADDMNVRDVFYVTSEGTVSESDVSNDDDGRGEYTDRKEASSVRTITSQNAWLASMQTPILDRFIVNAFQSCDEVDTDVMIRSISPEEVESRTNFGTHRIPVAEWFKSDKRTDSLRETFAELCRPPVPSRVRSGLLASITLARDAENPRELPETFSSARACVQFDANDSLKKFRHAVIYQRDTSRKFIDFDELVQNVQRTLGSHDWKTSVIMHNDQNPPCLLTRCLGNTDLLITPHGFQSMLTMFLPKHAYMFEVFPTRYYWTGYKALGLAFAVKHAWFESSPRSILSSALALWTTTPWCMELYICRYLARKGNVLLDKVGLSIVARSRNEIQTRHEDTRTHALLVPTGDPFVACVRHCELDSWCKSFSGSTSQLDSTECVFERFD